ncbi:flavodoxin family protein [bacterium]|nr:flavodoxin family protein [bacterium]
MKILVIKSSPHKNGASNFLADKFIQGAKENNHDVIVFDAGHKEIKPCIACNVCKMKGPCVHKDTMVQLQDILLESDMVVFATPLYYFGMPAQLKVVIDRFYNINSKITEKNMKSALIVSAWDDVEWTLKDIKEHYLTICRYLHFDNMGIILGAGCGNLTMTQQSPYPLMAYELGKKV